MFRELPSASNRVRHNLAAVVSHLLQFEVSRWNDLPYTVFDTETFYFFNGTASLP